MNKFSQFLFILLALALASIISLFTYRSLSTKPNIDQSATENITQNIVVAAADIARGSIIENQHLRMTKYLQDSIPPGSFSKLDQVVGRIVKQSILASEPILESRLVSADITKGGLAALVTKKKRAMSVKVDEVIGVSGYLNAGHRVDVLVSIQRKGEKEGYISKTVLENIKVLSAGGGIEEEKDKEKKKVINVITLEVTPEEGEKLALAVTKGKIQLALRSYVDSDDALTKGMTVDELLKSYHADEQMFVETKPVILNTQEVTQTPSPPVTRKKKSVIIAVMNGAQVAYIEGGK
ncbi:MAG: Flp pilus assembly protein CpaB [Desulfobulbaceae bacterium]|nr:Flp pilus assembly protein CpaB [Desulfobulbaceae bacterium]